ncbi:MAG: 6-carboxytetrahydropterin synthase [Arenicella sp.]|jgi:6-pyruvoyltetrahydropterin/6-carboxytetrahydropterin synthase|nr:6-carboxytetrahydropterin synthase [Arenicella sp.]
MNRLATIVIDKQYLHFSIAHFTIFSATSRERLHGHNVRIGVSITGEVDDNGLCFDYAVYKKILKALCAKYDEYTLIAKNSPHLKISEDDDFYHVEHNGINMPLLKTDTILLPVLNVTIEELAYYLLNELIVDRGLLDDLKIHAFETRVSSGPDQWARCAWDKKTDSIV